MELEGTKNFSILDSRETSTLAFMVNEPDGDSIYRTLQKLDCSMNEVEAGIKRTFFIIYNQPSIFILLIIQ